MRNVAEVVIGDVPVLPGCCRRRGFTYVLGAGDSIKIGRTAGDPIKRIRGIQGASPVPITILGMSRGLDLETALHDALSRLRMHGEWFRAEAWERISHLFGGQQCASCLLSLSTADTVCPIQRVQHPESVRTTKSARTGTWMWRGQARPTSRPRTKAKPRELSPEERRQRVREFIATYKARHGRSPTYKQIEAGLARSADQQT